ncbi:MAG: hypothetical protein ABJH63_02135 [Rhizobiaceae bacterium]
MLILATNRFCDIDTHSRLTLEQYSEAFNLLIGQVSKATRQIISRRLAHSNFTPRSVALYLAMEPISVAMPIVANSLVLGQLDVMRIIDRMGLDHARAAASRLDIGPSLVKALQALDDDEVLIALEDNDALLGNLENRNVDALFAKIDDSDALLTQTNLEQASVAPEITETEIDYSGSIDIETSLEPAPAEVEYSQPNLPAATTAPLNEAERALLAAAGRGNRADLAPMARPMENEFDFGDAFEKVARAHSHQGMAVLMQKRFDLSLDTAQTVLQDRSGDTLAVLLSAAEVPAAQANRIQLLTHPTVGLSSHNALRAVRFYAQLNSDSSRAAVAKWPKAKDPKINHQPQLEPGREQRFTADANSTRDMLVQEPLQATG